MLPRVFTRRHKPCPGARRAHRCVRMPHGPQNRHPALTLSSQPSRRERPVKKLPQHTPKARVYAKGPDIVLLGCNKAQRHWIPACAGMTSGDAKDFAASFALALVIPAQAGIQMHFVSRRVGNQSQRAENRPFAFYESLHQCGKAQAFFQQSPFDNKN